MNQILQILFNVQTAYAQVAGAKDVANETQGQFTELIAGIIAKIPLWITAFVILLLTFVVAKIVKGYVENKMITEGFEEEHKELSIVAGRSANAIVLTIGITSALKIAGLDLTAIIAAGAFGIGFALRDLIMNFIAGVMILTARHYTIGDIIKVKNILGKIEEIQARATIVKNFDGTKVVIPNAELFKNPVTSYTSNPFRRIAISVGVEYGSDLKVAMAACLKAAKESKNALAQPKPGVAIAGFGQSSINIVAKVWVESSKGVIKTKTSLIQNLKKELSAAGIHIPFPIQTLVFDEDVKRDKKEQFKISSEEAKDHAVDELLAEPTKKKTKKKKEKIKQEVVTEEVMPKVIPETSVSPTPEATVVEEQQPEPKVQPVAETSEQPQQTQAPEWVKQAADTTPVEQPAVEVQPELQPVAQPEAPAPTTVQPEQQQSPTTQPAEPQPIAQQPEQQSADRQPVTQQPPQPEPPATPQPEQPPSQ